MKKISEYLFLWTLGGCLYYSFEILFRGFSHWSMFVLGGISLLFCTRQGQMVKWEDPMWVQILRCTLFVVSLEFITGIIVNKWLGLYIWDYTDQPLQLFRTDLSPFCHHIFGPVRLRDLSWRISGPLALRRDSSHPSFPLAEEEIEKFSLSYSHRKCYNIRMISVTEEENKIGRINTHDAAICRHKKRISGLHPVL